MEQIASLKLQTNLFINGQFVTSPQGKKFQTLNPSTEEVIAEVWEGSKEDVNQAVQAAKNAFHGPWRKLSASDRGELLRKLSQLIQKNKTLLANIESLDNGKPVSMCQDVDIDSCIKVFEYYAGWCDKISGKTITIPGPYFCYTRREPLGVCGLIVPWNFPLLMATWKLAPALAAGNTVILKPAEQTPLSALKLAELINEAGFPPGVVNIVTGHGETGAHIVDHPEVSKIAFTGSTEVGQIIMQRCSINNLKKVTLELGGKSPLIVMDDANIEEALEMAHMGVFFNQGQVCDSSSRIFVHEKIYDQFVQKSVEKVKNIKIGNPFDQGVTQGPQIDQIQFEKILNYMQLGQKEGAKLQCGGKRHGNKGYFIEPTIFSDVQDNMTIAREEIFGPSMQILKFSNIDEVIKRANSTHYGLASSIFTSSIENYLKFTNAVQSGTVYVNCYFVGAPSVPFGGYKMSGFGKDLGEECLEGYLQSKVVIVKQTDDTIGF